MKTRWTFFEYVLTFLTYFVLLVALTYFALTYGFNAVGTTFVLTMSVAAALVVSAMFLFVQAARRKRADRLAGVTDLAASPALFLELFKNSPVAYLLVNAAGTIEYVNNATLRLFGAAKGQLEGQNAFNLLESEDPDHMFLIPQKLSEGVSVTGEEVRVKRGNGMWRWVDMSAFPFKDRGMPKALLTLVDITKQKQIDQAKTEFVSLASHQLRTPISSMKWNIELLHSKKSGELNEKQHKYLAKIERGVQRMDTLIRDFLNVSKLELGTYAVQKKQTSMTGILQNALSEQDENIAAKRLILETELDKTVDTLIADEKLLLMIIGNLVSNAVKYTPEGGAVTIRTAGNERRVTFTIADSGVGIPKEEQDKLFSKLFRASNARENVPDGTGLGLYIVKHAVTLLGGDISVDSEENVGTVFTVVLPR